MSTVFPFKAYLPAGDNAAKVASLPYDVMTRQEARQVVEGKPLSFLRVTLADLELPDEISSYDERVYAQAAANFRKLCESVLVQDDAASYYIYSLVMDGRRQTGIVGCASVPEYKSGIVRRHEFTRKEKEDDRTNHIISTGAQTGPVFLAYRDNAAINEIVAQVMAQEAPLFDFVADDGIGHTGWRIPADLTARVADAFDKQVPILYIADGHHRAAAAARTCDAKNGAGESARTMAVIFPASQLKILAYNRVVKDLKGMTAEEFLAKLATVGTVSENAPAVPKAAGEVSIYMGGKWYGLSFNERHPEDPIENLDVSLLQKQVLEPMLGIQDPRRDQRIDFVGGIRGTAELEKRVNAGEAVAFSMYPTSLEQLMRVADANGIMPPKSTWFEPKLRDGLFTHLI
ncbi:MAG: DUF1015 family protein [Lentisphaeria bacterium]|nr:DUF1015 family protein [Lentisphaeria bacterium]